MRHSESVALHKFIFIELFGALGRGTPDDPGSDYGLFVAIDASTSEDALEWGFHIHGDFARARTQYIDWQHDGSPIRDGEIDGDADVAALLAENPKYAICKVGEYPNWLEPWKNCNADGVRNS